MNKKCFLWGVLSFVFCAHLWGSAPLITVRGEVTGAWHSDLAVCNGKEFFPVQKDGTFSFSFTQKSGTPFVYLAVPDGFKALSPWKAQVKTGENTLLFRIAPRQIGGGDFNFIHGSDVQFDFLSQKKELEDLADSIAAVMKQNRCDFITFPGDLTTHGDIPHLQALKEALDKRKITYFEVFGGHDALRSKPLPLSHFIRVFGAPYSSWNWNKIHFVAPVTEFHFLTSEERTRHLEWLKNDLRRLAPGMPVIILTHLPAALPKEYMELLKSSKRKILAFLGAHHHLDALYTLKGTVNIYNTPLRTLEAGSLTRKLRLVTLSSGKLRETRTLFLGYDHFISGFLCKNGKAVIRICDTASSVKSAWMTSEGHTFPLTKKNDFFWVGTVKTPGKFLVTALFSDGRTVKKELTLAPDKKIKWCYAADTLFLQRPEAVHHKGRIYFNTTSANFPGKGGVTALDGATGKKLWHTPLPGNIDAPVALWGNQLFALSAAGVFYVLDAPKGKIIKTIDLASQLESNSFIRCTAAPVVTAKGKVFLQGTGLKHALYDAVTQKISSLDFRTSHAFYSAAASGTLIAFTSPVPCLFDTENNKLLWKVGVSTGAGSQAAPVFDTDGVYLALQRTLIKVSLATGKVVWSQKTWGRRQEMGGLALSGKQLIFSASNKIGIFDAVTGKSIKKPLTLPRLPGRCGAFRTPLGQAPLLIWKGKVLIPSDMGGLQLFDPATRKLTAMTDPGLSFQGKAAAADKTICLVSSEGLILAVSE